MLYIYYMIIEYISRNLASIQRNLDFLFLRLELACSDLRQLQHAARSQQEEYLLLLYEWGETQIIM